MYGYQHLLCYMFYSTRIHDNTGIVRIKLLCSHSLVQQYGKISVEFHFNLSSLCPLATPLFEHYTVCIYSRLFQIFWWLFHRRFPSSCCKSTAFNSLYPQLFCSTTSSFNKNFQENKTNFTVNYLNYLKLFVNCWRHVQQTNFLIHFRNLLLYIVVSLNIFHKIRNA